jgi:hypothetical protein
MRQAGPTHYTKATHQNEAQLAEGMWFYGLDARRGRAL